MTRHITPDVLAEAKRLHADGLNYAEIGERLGFRGESIRRALDPAYAQHRRDQINVARADRGYWYGRSQRGPDALEFDHSAYSQPVYRKFVPNRLSLTSAPLTERSEGFWITLPMVSILRAEA